jgi:hypothetical protein
VFASVADTLVMRACVLIVAIAVGDAAPRNGIVRARARFEDTFFAIVNKC